MSAFGKITKSVYILLSVFVELLEKSRWDDSCVMLHCNPETYPYHSEHNTNTKQQHRVAQSSFGEICA